MSKAYIPTEKERHIIKHSLGLTTAKDSYRNYFNPGEDSDDFKCCENLYKNGLMIKRSLTWAPGYLYHVTELGKQAIGE